MNRSTNNVLAFFFGFVAVIAILSQCGTAEAADNYQHTLGVICCSEHVREQDKTLNEDNRGAFYRYDTSYEGIFMVGTFKNSFNRQAVFIGGGPKWKFGGGFEASLPIGLTTGYLEGFSPFILPTVSYKYVNVHVIPSVVYAVSFNVVRW